MVRTTVSVDEMIDDALNDSALLSAFADTLQQAMDQDEEPYYKKSRQLLQLYQADEITDDALIALTGFDLGNLLLKSRGEDIW
jgi:type III secretory pathway component EscR